jgi:hypothetical protein
VKLTVESDQGINRVFEVSEVYDPTKLYCTSDGGYASGSCNGAGYDLGGASLDSVQLAFVVDPVVQLNISLTNNSATTQTFILTATLPTDPFAGPNRMGGSLTGGVTESNGNTASLSAVTGGAIYSALIDGATVATLLPAPFSIGVGVPFESMAIPPNTAFGQPIPSAAAPSVLGELGLRYAFRLSPGDQAGLLGVFVVETPEPALSPLLGLAALALVALRRARA